MRVPFLKAILRKTGVQSFILCPSADGWIFIYFTLLLRVQPFEILVPTSHLIQAQDNTFVPFWVLKPKLANDWVVSTLPDSQCWLSCWLLWDFSSFISVICISYDHTHFLKLFFLFRTSSYSQQEYFF